jgi:hypothetical protein
MIHRVHVYKTYMFSGEKRTPYKWRFDCLCGAGGISWSWDRKYEAIQSGMDIEAYLAEGNSLYGGALPMALEHLAAVAQRPWGWRHVDDLSPCTSYPDSLNFTKTDDLHICGHDRTMAMVEIVPKPQHR